MRHALTVAYAYLTTRWRAKGRQSRDQLKRYQAAKLKAFLSRKAHKVEAYRDVASSELSDFPIVDKSVLMADFERFNTAGIDAATGWKIFEGSKTLGRYTIGASTGTSGNRGLFVVSDTERHRWLGVILAKALPGFWRSPQRVAVILPLNTPLYDTANRSRRLKVAFFDLTLGPDSWKGELETFKPTVIIAPPKILRWLAEERLDIEPVKIFSAAEPLDDLDRVVIEAAFGARLGQIYMATEGLLAVSCEFGMLHLCEDTMFFELQPISDNLVSPVITDFSRETQIMLRYRMNDLLQLADEPCRCGSALQAVSKVIGRMDDCFHLISSDGLPRMLTPDIIRNAVVDADRSIDDYRVVQTSDTEVELVLPGHITKEAKTRAVRALKQLFLQHGLEPQIHLIERAPKLETGQKLRRVENRSGSADV